MMSKPARPTGVTVLAILELFGGIITILFGMAAIVSSTFLNPYGYAVVAGLAVASGGALVLFGVLAVVVGYGMWSGKGWSWTLAVVLYGLGVVFSLVYIAVGLWSNILALAIDLLILWYLWRPHVKAYFGKRQPVPVTTPQAPAATP